jgi:hypothetical protein
MQELLHIEITLFVSKHNSSPAVGLEVTKEGRVLPMQDT